MSLNVGSRLGHYDATALIGEGGMGQVYRARDTKLNRDVALKVLPDVFANDPERLARFQREAQVLASLNHPNIASIYGLEEADGIRALVLELVEGPTLAERIAQGPIAIDEALPIARQMAEALEAAHEAGVIHRDLKPANVKVKADGMVKVLDFGLAKAFAGEAPGADLSESPTVTGAGTREGVILGTAAYMSPEQARGKLLDKRTDIWAFGCVLYEVLTGKAAFVAETLSDTIVKILDREPDWQALPADTPALIRRLVRRCLDKDPKERLRDIGDARVEIWEAMTAPLTEGVAAVPVAAQAVWWRRAILLALATLVVGSLIGGLTVWRVTRTDPPRVVRFAVSPDMPETLVIGSVGPDVTISRDGQQIAYLATGGAGEGIHVRSLDQLTPTTLAIPDIPFFSPHGEWLGFYDNANLLLKKVPVDGGPALTICELPGLLRGAAWGPDDTIIFATAGLDTGLWQVPAAGGKPEALTTPDPDEGEVDHRWPTFLPGGEAVLFTITASRIQDSQIAVLSLAPREQKILVRGGSHPQYSPTGHLVYGVEGSLWAVRFDADRLEVLSDPVPVLEGVVTKPGGAASFSVAENGALVYVSGSATADRTLGWVNREGEMTPVMEDAPIVGMPRLSPDGTQVALALRGQSTEIDIWIRDLEQDRDTRLTVAGSVNLGPAWTPDGRNVTFVSNRSGPHDLYWKSADGSGEAESLVATANLKVPGSWSPDGQSLVYSEAGGDTNGDILVFTLDGDASPFLVREFNEKAPRLSPDGHWLAYVSDQSGEDRVYVQRFPQGGRVIAISAGRGTEPVWSRDGQELFYRDGNQMMVVDVETEPAFSAGRPRLLFDEAYEMDPTASERYANYDVSLDGEQFLMVRRSGSQTAALIVVHNWFEELKRLVPAN